MCESASLQPLVAYLVAVTSLSGASLGAPHRHQLLACDRASRGRGGWRRVYIKWAACWCGLHSMCAASLGPLALWKSTQDFLHNSIKSILPTKSLPLLSQPPAGRASFPTSRRWRLWLLTVGLLLLAFHEPRLVSSDLAAESVSKRHFFHP